MTVTMPQQIELGAMEPFDGAGRCAVGGLDAGDSTCAREGESRKSKQCFFSIGGSPGLPDSCVACTLQIRR